MSEELMGSVLATVDARLTPQEKEDLVLFPETHTKKAKLLDVEFDLRPLSISACKKIAKRIAPVSLEFDHIVKTRGDAGNPDLDLDTIDALLDCVVFMSQFYKLPTSISRERIEEEASPEDILDIIKWQLMINRDNNFLLQNLRGVVQMIDLAALLPTISPNPPSTLPIVSDSESDSENLLTPIPTDS